MLKLFFSRFSSELTHHPEYQIYIKSGTQSSQRLIICLQDYVAFKEKEVIFIYKLYP